MTIPSSLKSIAPSLKIGKDAGEKEIATLRLADLKSLFPSLEINIDNAGDPLAGTAKISIQDLRKILAIALAGVEVDPAWYLSQVGGLRQDIQRGKFKSPDEHYINHGYLESRLPFRPTVDEKFYLEKYADVAANVKSGKIRSGYDHFVQDGYAEGRLPIFPLST